MSIVMTVEEIRQKFRAEHLHIVPGTPARGFRTEDGARSLQAKTPGSFIVREDDASYIVVKPCGPKGGVS